jgi:hypothetical protein
MSPLVFPTIRINWRRLALLGGVLLLCLACWTGGHYHGRQWGNVEAYRFGLERGYSEGMSTAAALAKYKTPLEVIEQTVPAGEAP